MRRNFLALRDMLSALTLPPLPIRLRLIAALRLAVDPRGGGRLIVLRHLLNTSRDAKPENKEYLPVLFALALTGEDGTPDWWTRWAARGTLRTLEGGSDTPIHRLLREFLHDLAGGIRARQASSLRHRRPEQKIVLFVSSLRVSGGPRILLNTHKALVECHPQLQFVIAHGACSKSQSRVSLESALAAGAKEVSLDILRGEFDHKRVDHVIALLQMLLAENPLVVHIFEWRSEAVKIAAEIANVPVVIHSTLGEHLKAGHREFESLLPWLTTVFVHESPIELTRWSEDRLTESGGRHCVIPSHFDLHPFLCATRDDHGRRWRRDHGLDDSAFLIGGSGVFSGDRQKGFDVLVLSFFKWLQIRGDSSSPGQLVLLGEGEDREEISTMAETLKVDDAVFFCDFQAYEEMPAFFAALDVFALPSRYEGVAGTLMQAMTAGTPLVCTDCGGTLSIVTHEEEALVVPLYDRDRRMRDEASLAEEFAWCFDRYRLDPGLAGRMGQRAQARARRQFDPGATKRALREIYDPFIREELVRE